MNQYGRLLVKERQRLLDASTRLQQSVALVRNTYVKAEVTILLQVIDDLPGVVVHIDDDPLKASRLQFHDDMPEQGLSPYPHQCLWHRVSQGFQTGTQTRREDHRLFHVCKVTNKSAHIQIILNIYV